MRTGTADYFDSIVSSLACRGIDRSQIIVVIDDALADTSLQNVDYLGFKVVSYRQLSDVVEDDQVRVYFLANNEYHAYCYESLSRLKKYGNGKVISVIHEPSCFMLFNNLCSNRRNSFSDDQFIMYCSSQFGFKSQDIIENRRNDVLPFEVEYVIHCQYLALTHSDEIWTHSEFCALKLQFEVEVPSDARFVVSEHPRLQSVRGRDEYELPAELAKAEGTFRVGIFGWVSPSKRIDVAIRAFAAALQTVPHERRSTAQLLIVGKLPRTEDYDPVGIARSLGVEAQVEFLDYVPIAHFEALIESCNLLLNLRFPSCGETSGTLERAVAAGVPVITTEYQGFAELPTSAQISCFWPAEHVQLFRILSQCLAGGADLKPAVRPSGKVGIAELISLEVFSR